MQTSVNQTSASKLYTGTPDCFFGANPDILFGIVKWSSVQNCTKVKLLVFQEITSVITDQPTNKLAQLQYLQPEVIITECSTVLLLMLPLQVNSIVNCTNFVSPETEKLEFLGYTFAADSSCMSLLVFIWLSLTATTNCPPPKKKHRIYHIMTICESFNIVCLGVNEKPMTDYLLRHKKSGLIS